MSPAGMAFLRPASLAEALEAKAAHPDAVPIAGGTDVMVELNFDARRPPALLDLTRITELAEWGRDADTIRLGAGVSYTRVIEELRGVLPGLAAAARTVGSPQIRNRGTVGGNLPATAIRRCWRRGRLSRWRASEGYVGCRWRSSTPGRSGPRSHRTSLSSRCRWRRRPARSSSRRSVPGTRW
jgi:CO/xanthine dehydrogenase FAD-binding subunit